MNIQQMMKQAQQMQVKMQEMQERLGDTEVSGSAGGGLVNVTMTCKGEVRKMSINPSVINPDDKEMLEDLIIVAMNAARQVADETLASETQKMMADLGMPANVKLPF